MGIGLAHPVAEAGGLGDAPAHVAQIDAAHQLPAVAAEDEQAIALIAAPFGRHLAQPAAIGGEAERIVGPARLPGHEEIAARRRAATDQARQSVSTRPAQHEPRRLQPRTADRWSKPSIAAQHRERLGGEPRGDAVEPRQAAERTEGGQGRRGPPISRRATRASWAASTASMRAMISSAGQGPAIGQDLARQLLGAVAGRFPRHQDPGLGLRPGPVQLLRRQPSPAAGAAPRSAAAGSPPPPSRRCRHRRRRARRR